MSKHHFNEVVLQPGELFVGEAQHRIKTLLGSCVSITLWEPQRKIGAMSHFLLPERRGNSSPQLDGRYGREALSLMIAGLHAKGVSVERCIAKVFGGGDMFPARPAKTALLAVGQQNGEAARQLLREHGLTPSSECLFGAGHRQIIFEVQSGDVWVRKVSLDGDGVVEQKHHGGAAHQITKSGVTQSISTQLGTPPSVAHAGTTRPGSAGQNEERIHGHDQSDGSRRLGRRAAGGHRPVESGQRHRGHGGGR